MFPPVPLNLSQNEVYASMSDLAKDEIYANGRRDESIVALGRRADAHDRRFTDHETKFDSHEGRFRVIERMMWLLMGAIAFMNFYPALKALLGLPV